MTWDCGKLYKRVACAVRSKSQREVVQWFTAKQGLVV